MGQGALKAKRPDFISVTELPERKVSWEERQVICSRYYFASQFVSGKQVLEVGCGPGLGLGLLANKGAERVIGGDCIKASLKYAQNHYRGSIGLVLLDAHKLPFKSGCFDIVLAMAMIYYLQIDVFLEECRRVLRKGGTLVFCTPNKNAPGFHRSPFSTEYYSIPELNKLLSRHNFEAEILGAFPVIRPTLFKVQHNIRYGIGRTLDSIPKGKEIKGRLERFINRKTLILEEEIGGDANGDFCIVPLSVNSFDSRYKVLYVLAHVR